MTPEVQSSMLELGVALTQFAVKGTVSAVQTKVKAIKEEKAIERVRNRYDEIITELLEEREEIIRIAQTYRSEIERIEISDEDIEHLHNTIDKAITILFDLTEQDDYAKASFNAIKDLVNVDTLKTMQLLGFNYKEAIGIPLTKLCAKAIETWGNKKQKQSGRK